MQETTKLLPLALVLRLLVLQLLQFLEMPWQSLHENTPDIFLKQCKISHGPIRSLTLSPPSALPNAFYRSIHCAAMNIIFTLATAFGHKHSIPLVIIPQHCGLFLAFSSKLSPLDCSCFAYVSAGGGGAHEVIFVLLASSLAIAVLPTVLPRCLTHSGAF